MKKLKNILLFCIFSLFIPLGVSAETFYDKDIEYNLEEKTFPCAEGMHYVDTDKNGNYIFENPKTDNIEYVKVNNNVCTKLTNQEILDLWNNQIIESYRIEHDSFNNIYKFTDFGYSGGLVKTEDKTVVSGKQYYNSNFDEIPSPNNNDINSYYELHNFTYPKSATIDNTLTYYKSSKNGIYEKVSNPNSKNILDYLVMTQASGMSEELFTTIGNGLRNSLSRITYFSMQVIPSEDLNEFYFKVGTNIYYPNTYTIFNTAGEAIFKDVLDFQYYSNNLLSVTTEDGIEIYNTNLELLYTMKELTYLYENSYYNNVLFLTGGNDEFESYYELTTNKILPENPDTYDGITVSFIIGTISLLGLIILLYLKIKNNKYL